MPDTAALFAAASEQQGLGNTLRILLIASIAGAACLPGSCCAATAETAPTTRTTTESA
ncbi:hypothetical protein [Streptomyces sp. NPDC005407]|uniref:hypothetical protein n=1 Tax=Streptomyces sp. NPDC005407 TaxID=3155340 RepID=UPI0033AAFD52